MSVMLTEIRQMATAVLDTIEANGVTELTASSGFYWDIDSAAAWDLTQEPSLQTGDLADDIQDIRKDLSQDAKTAAMLSWHTLDHLIGVLTALPFQHKARLGLLEKES